MSPLGDVGPSHHLDTRVEMLRTSDCPHVDEARSLLSSRLAELRLGLSIQEREGDYPSPTILVNGVDVIGRTNLQGAMCRLDLPTRDRIVAALPR